MQVAFAALRTKDSYFKARFWKVAARADNNRAAFAIAHSIFKVIHGMLSSNVDYKALGGDYFDRFMSRPADLGFGASTPIHELRGHTDHDRLIKRISCLVFMVACQARWGTCSLV